MLQLLMLEAAHPNFILGRLWSKRIVIRSANFFIRDPTSRPDRALHFGNLKPFREGTDFHYAFLLSWQTMRQHRLNAGMCARRNWIEACIAPTGMSSIEIIRLKSSLETMSVGVGANGYENPSYPEGDEGPQMSNGKRATASCEVPEGPEAT
jgi:hypothetical protein